MGITNTGQGTGPHPLFGRDEAMSEIARLLERVRDGTGQGLLVSGQGGIGKSDLMRSSVHRGQERGFRVLSGRALPLELPPPFSLLRGLGNPAERGPSPSDSRSGRSMDPPLYVVPTRLDDGIALVTHPSPDTPVSGVGDGTLAPLIHLGSDAVGVAREELFGRAIGHLIALARTSPLLLAIDDLHFADASSLEALQRLAREFAQAPIALIATVAPIRDVPERVRGVIEAMSRGPGWRTITLRPLSVAEVGELARFILGGGEPDPADVLRWHAQTEGNPLFVEEIIRAATGSGPRIPVGSVGAVGSLTDILLSRVGSLSEADRRILTHAAVIGTEFSFSILAAVAGTGEEAVTESLDRLVHQGLLRERGNEVYGFATEQLRASVYADLTETRRRILHRKAGRFLEGQGTTSPSELARQFYLGRDDAKAVEFNLRAAQGAEQAFAFDTATRHLAWALEAERRRPDRDRGREIRLRTEEGRLLGALGNLTRSEEALGEAVELARSSPGRELELGRALLALAQTRADRSDYGSARDLANEALELLRRVGDPRDRMFAHRILGVTQWRLGDRGAAGTDQRAAVEIAERDGTPLEHGHALIDIANTMVLRGARYFEPALALYARAAELFVSADDPAAHARVLMNRAVLEYESGRTDDALADLGVAITSAERSRSPVWIGYCQINLAQWQAELGRPGPARAAMERAVHALRPLGDHLADQQIALTRAMVAEAETALPVAEDSYQEALQRARELNLVAEASEVLFRLARLSYRSGNLGEARERLAEARESGLLVHRPDLAARVAELEKAIASE